MENKLDSAIETLCNKIKLHSDEVQKDVRADDILKYSQSVEHLMNAKNILFSINDHKNTNK